MSPQELIEEIRALTPAQQDLVRQFVSFLKRQCETAQSPFRDAIDEFIEEHPELLRQLAL